MRFRREGEFTEKGCQIGESKKQNKKQNKQHGRQKVNKYNKMKQQGNVTTKLQTRVEHSNWHCECKNMSQTHQSTSMWSHTLFCHVELKKQEKHERQSKNNNATMRNTKTNLQNRVEQSEWHL